MTQSEHSPLPGVAFIVLTMSIAFLCVYGVSLA